MSELTSMDDAFRAALNEAEGISEPEPVEEPVAEEAVIEDPETATEVPVEPDDSEVEELFELDDEGEVAPPEPVAQSVNLDEMTFEIPGVDTPVPFQELRDGYLRQADYTRKTQAVADQRKSNERAVQLYDAIQADPMGVARQIAEEVGLIQPGSQPAQAVEFSVFDTADAVEAEIARRVEQEVANHPSVQQANLVAGQQWVDGEFAKIEQAHGVTLGPKSRQAILKFAGDRGVTDLDLVFNHLSAQKQQRAEGTRQVANAAPGRPQGRAKELATVEAVDSIEKAFELAEAGVGG